MSTLRLLSLVALTAFLPACGGGGGGSSQSGVAAPVAGQYWGGSKVIRWVPFHSTGGAVKIELFSNGSWATLSSSTPDDGQFPWDTSLHADAGDCRIRISTADHDSASSGVFTLDNTAPIVTLTSPLGGELWGGERVVSWSTLDDNKYNVDIFTSPDSGSTFPYAVTVATPDDGVQVWDTSDRPDGDFYRVSIVATDRAGNVSSTVVSTGDFELDNTAPVVAITSPNGGESWEHMQSVTWTTTDPNPGTVNVDLSTTSGASFSVPIASDVPDTGSMAWSSGFAPDSSTLRMRVVATDGAGNVSAPSYSANDFTVANLRMEEPVLFLDTNFNAVIDQGDELVLVFDKDINVTTSTVGSLNLGVDADAFGSGASIAAGPEAHMAVVTLGSNPVLRTRGMFDVDQDHAGRPSGVDISPSIATGAIQDGSGRTAAPSGPKDLQPGFVSVTPLTPGTDLTQRGTLGDLTGDGILDMVVASPGGAFDRVFTGDGSGGWTTSATFGAADSNAVEVGDFDQDGDLDVAVAATGFNTVWMNDGAGNLTDSGQTLGASDSRDLVVFDADRDGDLDLAFANGAGQPNTVWFNDGAGTFTTSHQSMGTSDTRAVLYGDFDGDGDEDLIFGNHNGEESYLWRNNSNGQFAQGAMATDSYLNDLDAGDLNGDGNLDLFVAVSGQSEVILGYGDGTFAPVHAFLGNNDQRAACLLDLDGDGDLDAVTAKHQDAPRYWINDGGANFTQSPRRGISDHSTDLLCGYVDGDGDLDLVVVNDLHAHRTYRASYAGGQPSADYTDGGVSLGTWRSGAPSSGDVNLDGRADVIVPDRDGGFHVLIGNGLGDLTEQGSYGSSPGREGVLFDADRDGDLDYLFRTGDWGDVDELWIGDGTGNFIPSTVTFTGSVIVPGDVDRDGDVDLMHVAAGQFEIWDGNGSGSFSPTGQTGDATDLEFWEFYDLDQDGDLDFLQGRPNDLQVWSGDGAGNFTFSASINTGATASDAVVVDYDTDGDPDMVFATTSALVHVRNDGGMSFDVRGASGPSGLFAQLFTFDANEDGKSDYLAVESSSSTWALAFGNGTDSLTPAPSVPVSQMSLGIPVDLDGDGDMDFYWSCDDTLFLTPVQDRVELFD